MNQPLSLRLVLAALRQYQVNMSTPDQRLNVSHMNLIFDLSFVPQNNQIYSEVETALYMNSKLIKISKTKYDYN